MFSVCAHFLFVWTTLTTLVGACPRGSLFFNMAIAGLLVVAMAAFIWWLLFDLSTHDIWLFRALLRFRDFGGA